MCDGLLNRHPACRAQLEVTQVELGNARLAEQPRVERVDADERGRMLFLQRREKLRHVARIGDECALGSELEERQGRSQRIHVIERQRDGHRFDAFLQVGREPRGSLLKVGDHVAVRKDGALRHPGRTARVLQKGNVFVVEAYVLEREQLGVERVRERDGFRNVPRGHHVLHVPHGEVHQPSFGGRQEIADLRGDDDLDLCLIEDLLERVREVLEHHDRGRS